MENRTWANSYGSAMGEEMARRVLNLKEDDFYFGSPDEMGIRGISIEDDFENVAESLNLSDVIDVEREKKLIKDGVKVLTKTRD